MRVLLFWNQWWEPLRRHCEQLDVGVSLWGLKPDLVPVSFLCIQPSILSSLLLLSGTLKLTTWSCAAPQIHHRRRVWQKWRYFYNRWVIYFVLLIGVDLENFRNMDVMKRTSLLSPDRFEPMLCALLNLNFHKFISSRYLHLNPCDIISYTVKILLCLYESTWIHNVFLFWKRNNIFKRNWGIKFVFFTWNLTFLSQYHICIISERPWQKQNRWKIIRIKIYTFDKSQKNWDKQNLNQICQ